MGGWVPSPCARAAPGQPGPTPHDTPTPRTLRRRHEVYDSKADVWSFGVLLAEIITTQIPYVHTYLTPVQARAGRVRGARARGRFGPPPCGAAAATQPPPA